MSMGPKVNVMHRSTRSGPQTDADCLRIHICAKKPFFKAEIFNPPNKFQFLLVKSMWL